jgi:DNA-binding FadR family transcriptional regulator
MNTIHAWVRRIPTTTLSSPGRGQEAFNQHQRLIDAIRRRDSRAAEDEARLHIGDAQRIRLQMLQGDLG